MEPKYIEKFEISLNFQTFSDHCRLYSHMEMIFLNFALVCLHVDIFQK